MSRVPCQSVTSLSCHVSRVITCYWAELLVWVWERRCAQAPATRPLTPAPPSRWPPSPPSSSSLTPKVLSASQKITLYTYVCIILKKKTYSSEETFPFSSFPLPTLALPSLTDTDINIVYHRLKIADRDSRLTPWQQWTAARWAPDSSWVKNIRGD